MSPGTGLSSLWRAAADFLMYLPWKYKITKGGADCPAPDTSHLFSVLPFPPLPILWNVAFLTSTFSRCCLQHALVLQAGIIFQAINWLLFFYIPEQNGPLLAVKCAKTHIHKTQNTKLLHTVCTSIIYCLLWHYSPDSVLFTTVLVFHQEKSWLCWKCVINYEVRSAIFWDFTQHRMVILTTTVLLDPWRWFPTFSFMVYRYELSCWFHTIFWTLRVTLPR